MWLIFFRQFVTNIESVLFAILSQILLSSNMTWLLRQAQWDTKADSSAFFTFSNWDCSKCFLQNLLTWMNIYPNVSLALTIFAETIFWSFLSPTFIELWRHTHLGCLTYQGTWPLGFDNTAANPCNSLLKKLIKKKRRIAKPEWQNMFAEGETSPLPIH